MMNAAGYCVGAGKCLYGQNSPPHLILMLILVELLH